MGCVELIHFIHEECDYQNQHYINTDKPANYSVSIPNTAFQLFPDLLRVPFYTDLLKKVQFAAAGSLSAEHAGWACTYYVYDDMNQLRFVIPPTLVDYLDANGWSLSQQLVNDLCFVYTYDLKGRVVLTWRQP